MKLLTIENAKTSKSIAYGYLTGILYLAPHTIAGCGNVCPKSTPGCRAACLYSAGRGAFTMVQNARIRKTRMWFQRRTEFLAQLQKDIDALKRKAKRMGLKPAVRLNGTSDIAFERVTDIVASNPDVQFYDYTAIPQRMLFDALPNYDLTFSMKEDNQGVAMRLLLLGFRVSVVFPTAEFPKVYLGFSVINGDTHDLRFLDGESVIVALYAKGKAKKDNTNFVRKVA